MAAAMDAPSGRLMLQVSCLRGPDTDFVHLIDQCGIDHAC